MNGRYIYNPEPDDETNSRALSPDYSLSRARIAISNPRNVAPFANGDLIKWESQSFIHEDFWLGTYRISVGVNPRTKAPAPSVRHTVRTQSIVDLYFCPVEGENPSVCIRDLIISMGYITAQS